MEALAARSGNVAPQPDRRLPGPPVRSSVAPYRIILVVSSSTTIVFIYTHILIYMCLHRGFPPPHDKRPSSSLLPVSLGVCGAVAGHGKGSWNGWMTHKYDTFRNPHGSSGWMTRKLSTIPSEIRIGSRSLSALTRHSYDSCLQCLLL